MMSDTEKTPETPTSPQPTLAVAANIENPEAGEALFSGVVYVSNKEKNLLLTTNGISLASATKTKSKSKEEDLLLPWRNVIWAEAEALESEESEQPDSSFCVYYICRQADKHLCKKCLSVSIEEGEVSRWINIIQEECLKASGRPKKLLVVINPASGGGKSKHVYDKAVAPLFELARIETTIKVTEKARHAVDIGQNEDFTGYNGIVSVGGDGTYQELLQGVVLQSQKKAGIDINNPDAQLAKPIITFGVIPAGSGNRVSGWYNDGVIEVETAALRIIRGEQHHGQAVAVFSKDKFVGIGSLNCAYGLFGDMIVKREELSWMGKARFLFASLAILLRKRRMFKSEVEYRQAKDTSDKSQDGTAGVTESAAEWTVYTGKGQDYCGIHAFVVEMADAGQRYVLNPFGKTINLFLDSGCNTVGFFKHVMMLANGKKLSSPVANLDVIENVTAFRIKVSRDAEETDETVTGARAKARQLENLVNIDGEALHLDSPEIDVRLHSSFVPVYGCLPT